MEMWTFRIEDQPLQAYVRTTQRQKWVDPRYKRYLGWKGFVRLLATVAGVPDTLPQECRAVVSVGVAWKNRQRLDGDNFCKGILDSLWAQDRRVTALYYTAFENTGIEKASVTVGIEREAKQNGTPVKKTGHRSQV